MLSSRAGTHTHHKKFGGVERQAKMKNWKTGTQSMTNGIWETPSITRS